MGSSVVLIPVNVPVHPTRLQRFGSFATRVGSLGISSVVAMSVSALNVALYARFLDPVVWGSAQLANRMLDLGHSLTLPGINESALMSAAQKKHGNYAKLIKLKTKMALVSALVLASIGGFYLFYGEFMAGSMILMASACFPLIAAGSGIPDAWMEGLGEIARLGQLRIVRAVLGLVGIAGLIAFAGSPLFYVAPLTGMALAACYAYRAARQRCENDTVDEDLLKFGIKLSPSRAVGGLLMSAEFLIVSLVLGIGMEGVAGWAAALVLPSYFKMFLGNIQSVISKRIYGSGEIDEKLKAMLPWTRLWFVISIVGAILALIFGQKLTLIVLGSKWIESAEIGSILLACTMLVSVTDFYAAVIVAERDVLFHNLSQYIGGTLTVVFSTIAAMFFGIYGVCAAKIATMAVLTALRLIFILRHWSISRNERKLQAEQHA